MPSRVIGPGFGATMRRMSSWPGAVSIGRIYASRRERAVGHLRLLRHPDRLGGRLSLGIHGAVAATRPAAHARALPRRRAAGPGRARPQLPRGDGSGLAAVRAIEGLELDPERREFLAESLPKWRALRRGPGRADRAARAGLEARHPLQHRPGPAEDLRSRRSGCRSRWRSPPPTPAPTSRRPGTGSTFRERAGDVGAHVHVAASLFHDMAPAAEMGLPAVWINRLGETRSSARRRAAPAWPSCARPTAASRSALAPSCRPS